MEKQNMKYLMLFIVLVFTSNLPAQSVPQTVSEPQYIVVDSKDNVFVTRKYGMLKIAPDGTITNLSKQGPAIGGMDRTWKNLIIDSQDNLYATEPEGTVIYMITVSADNKTEIKEYAGQQYGYKLEDGPVATAGLNVIDLMTIDSNDNIYVTSSHSKIKDAIGSNIVTDSYYLNDRNGPDPKYIKSSFPRFSVIRKIAGGVVSTLKTPDGKFILPHDVSAITTDNQGNIIYAAAGFARFIGKIDLAAGVISSIAGQPYKRKWCPVYTQGAAAQAEFVDPASAIITNKKGEILFTDIRLHRIIKIAGGKVSTLALNGIIDPCSANIAGSAEEGNKDGKALTALFNFPHGIAYDSKGNLFIADMLNHSIRKLSPDGMVTTFAK
jgi:NHL repeat